MEMGAGFTACRPPGGGRRAVAHHDPKIRQPLIRRTSAMQKSVEAKAATIRLGFVVPR
jgi:hypothetical protein